MAKLNKPDTWTEAVFGKFQTASYWAQRLQEKIPALPESQNPVNEYEIWKNALLVETFMKNPSR
ncbi:MAG TPA: hypothetical protein VIK59_05490 [Verrucomicrobiae bacterium]